MTDLHVFGLILTGKPVWVAGRGCWGTGPGWPGIPQGYPWYSLLAAASAFLLNTTPSRMVLFQLRCHAWFYERLNLWCVARFSIRFAIVTSVAETQLAWSRDR